MKTKMMKFAIVAAMLAVSVSDHAASSYSIQVDSQNLPLGGTAVLVIDVDGDGADGNAYGTAADPMFDNFSSYFWDADDKYSAATKIVLFGPLGTVVTVDIFNDTSVEGLNMFVLYFADTFGGSGPGEATPYGVLAVGQTVLNQSLSPSFTSVALPQFVTNEAGSSEVVPAPAALPAGVALMGMMLARRRRRAA